MGKLKGRGLPSRLGKPRSRLQSSPRDERERSRQRYRDVPWRAWYHKPEWKKLRAFVLDRDMMTCQRTGVALVGGKKAPNSAVVHHKTPHRGVWKLFVDPDNCEAVSKQWHDTEGQKEDLDNDMRLD